MNTNMSCFLSISIIIVIIFVLLNNKFSLEPFSNLEQPFDSTKEQLERVK